MIKCSIGICVYNEEKNISKLLESLFNQKLTSVSIDEIIVISSGSTDKTFDLVSSYAKKNKKIKLIKQKKRAGKASAVNIFIELSRNEILILCGGDLLLKPTTIQKLVQVFKKPKIGMAGAHPIPINHSDGSFNNFAGNLMWEFHHRVSLLHPKMGELIAFRKIFKQIPTNIGADEANIEPLILCQGFQIVYVPLSHVYNKPPSNMKDFIKQRRRNYWLHLAVKNEQHYMVSTINTFLVLKVVATYLLQTRSFHAVISTGLVASLELYSRILGWWDYNIAKKTHTIWESIPSTKELS